MRFIFLLLLSMFTTDLYASENVLTFPECEVEITTNFPASDVQRSSGRGRDGITKYYQNIIKYEDGGVFNVMCFKNPKWGRFYRPYQPLLDKAIDGMFIGEPGKMYKDYEIISNEKIVENQLEGKQIVTSGISNYKDQKLQDMTKLFRVKNMVVGITMLRYHSIEARDEMEKVYDSFRYYGER